MRRLRRIKPTPSLIISSIALFASLGGVSYGVATGSIDSREIKNNSVSTKDIRNNSVRSKDVRNGSLLSRDFKAGQLPSGPAGAAGPRGPAGRNGANGFGTLSYPFGQVDVPSTDTDRAAGVVPCDPGLFPTGGDAYAFDSTTGDGLSGIVRADGVDFDPDTGAPDGYFAEWENDGNQDVTIIVDAVCANASNVDAKSKQARKSVRPSGIRRLGH